MYPRANVSAQRVIEVLDTKDSILDGTFNKPTKKTGEIEFKNVSFKYPDADEYVLENISFKAKKGDTIAIIGSTGSGKSTIVNLLMRFYDVTDGEILIDGVNIKDYKLDYLQFGRQLRFQECSLLNFLYLFQKIQHKCHIMRILLGLGL